MAARASPALLRKSAWKSRAGADPSPRSSRTAARCRRCGRFRPRDRATAIGASPGRGRRPPGPKAAPPLRSSQLGGLVLDRDALGAHLFRLGAVRVALDRRRRAGLEHLLLEPAALHARGRRKNHVPGLARRFETHMAVRMLIAGLDDLAGEFQRIRAVVLAPAVVRRRRHRQQCGEEKNLLRHTRCSTQDFTDCSALGNPAGSVPPACAMSGRPPPLPPTCCATKFTSSPALTLRLASGVTPAIRLT